jgi:hypothetical protein
MATIDRHLSILVAGGIAATVVAPCPDASATLMAKRAALEARVDRAAAFLGSTGPADAAHAQDGNLTTAQFPNWPNLFNNFPNFPNFPNFRNLAPSFPNWGNY